MKAGKDYIGVGCGALIINDKNEILLLKRADNLDTDAGLWTRPGGKVEFHESVEAAVKREVYEETGIKVEIVKFLQNTDDFYENKTRHWVTFGYLVKYVSGEVKNMEPHKHTELRWFPIDQLPENLTHFTREALEVYLDSCNI